jgi:type IV secretory pathway VirB2 component (pilin)
MTDERNPALERLFATADRELVDEAFVADVMSRTGKWSSQRLATVLIVCVVAAPIAWLVSAPLNEALQWLMQLITGPLVDTKGITSRAVLPLNSIGGVLALALLALRAITRRLFSARG